jgi:biopolymer transport protein ExbD
VSPQERAGLAIPVVPLANVVLLLTLLFPLAGVGDGGGTTTALPSARHTVLARPGFAWIVVTLGEGGAVRYRILDGASASRDVTGGDALAAEASGILERDPARTLVVRAGAGTHYAVIDEVLDRLRRAGARSVVLETAEAP